MFFGGMQPHNRNGRRATFYNNYTREQTTTGDNNASVSLLLVIVWIIFVIFLIYIRFNLPLLLF